VPALVAGIHVCTAAHIKDVDGRDKPGHAGTFSDAVTQLHRFAEITKNIPVSPQSALADAA
jgi:hypothetical protein